MTLRRTRQFAPGECGTSFEGDVIRPKDPLALVKIVNGRAERHDDPLRMLARWLEDAQRYKDGQKPITANWRPRASSVLMAAAVGAALVYGVLRRGTADPCARDR